jgi:hypothetical protein
MKLTVRLVVVAALAALGYWLWAVCFPSPEAILHKRLTKVAELVSFTSKEGQIARVANVQQLAGYFSPEAEIQVDTPAQGRETVSGREELAQKVMGARQILGGLKVEFIDVNLTLAPDRTNATAELTGRAQVAGDRDAFVQELRFHFRKLDGEWLIVRVETVHTLD